MTWSFELGQETVLGILLIQDRHSSENKASVLSSQLGLVFGDYLTWNFSSKETAQSSEQETLWPGQNGHVLTTFSNGPLSPQFYKRAKAVPAMWANKNMAFVYCISIFFPG